jgi:putative transposase
MFGYTKQAYYKQLGQIENEVFQEEFIVGLIKDKREIWKRGSGRNLHQSLQEDFTAHDIKIGRDKFFELLRRNDLLIKSKRIRAKTTCSYHHFNKYTNLIENAVPTRANEIWVSDITYLWLQPEERFCYLSVITDLYSRKVVGHCVHESLNVKGCLNALKEALKGRGRNNQQHLIHHSDRGVQYCCNAYVDALQKNGIQISMTQTGDPLENAVAERIHKTIKEEFTEERQISFSNLATAKSEIKKYIDFYNQKRPHRSVAWLTPNEAHNCVGELKRLWKSYYNQSTKGGDLTEALAEE